MVEMKPQQSPAAEQQDIEQLLQAVAQGNSGAEQALRTLAINNPSINARLQQAIQQAEENARRSAEMITAALVVTGGSAIIAANVREVNLLNADDKVMLAFDKLDPKNPPDPTLTINGRPGQEVVVSTSNIRESGRENVQVSDAAVVIAEKDKDQVIQEILQEDRVEKRGRGCRCRVNGVNIEAQKVSLEVDGQRVDMNQLQEEAATYRRSARALNREPNEREFKDYLRERHCAHLHHGHLGERSPGNARGALVDRGQEPVPPR